MQRIGSTIPQTPGLSAQFATGSEIRGTELDENSLRTLHFSILPKINRADLSLGDISRLYAYAGGILRLFGKPHGTGPHQVFPVVGSHFFKKAANSSEVLRLNRILSQWPPTKKTVFTQLIQDKLSLDDFISTYPC